MALSLLAANNAQTVLAAGISSTATSLTVNAGTGTLFPSPVTGTSFFKLTIIDAATGSLTEIVHVTARNGDVFTIQRGQEGTVPRAWSANDIAANMMTAGTLSYILGNFQPLDPTLTALAALVGVANKLPYFNEDDTAALTDLTQVGRDIIGKSTIADVLTYLGIGEAPFALIRTKNLADLNDVAISRNNLGLKAGATLDVATQAEITAGTSGSIVTALGLSGFFDLAATAINGSIRIPDRPGGIIIAWGTAPIGGGGAFTVTFNSPPFVMPQVASGQGAGSFSPDHVVVNSVTNTGFTTYNQTLARKYIAIGK